MRAAYLFPGMASQYAGMGKDLAEQWPAARRVFSEANEVLGYDFADKCFHCTYEQLIATHGMRFLTMFTVSIASLRVLSAAGIQPAIVAGASGGIFASLVAAESISFADALLCLQQRGEILDTIPLEQRGGMLPLITANEEVRLQVEAIAREEGIQVALYNTPLQIVYAGTLEQLDRLRARIKTVRGIYIPKPSRFSVVNAHHSPLLLIVQEQWSALVCRLTLRKPRLPVLLASTNEIADDVQDIREALLDQNTGTVYWRQCFERLLQARYDAYLEVGPGQTLQKMARDWKRDERQVLTCGTAEGMTAALAQLEQTVLHVRAA